MKSEFVQLGIPGEGLGENGRRETAPSKTEPTTFVSSSLLVLPSGLEMSDPTGCEPARSPPPKRGGGGDAGGVTTLTSCCFVKAEFAPSGMSKGWCEDRLGTGLSRARTEVTCVDLGY